MQCLSWTINTLLEAYSLPSNLIIASSIVSSLWVLYWDSNWADLNQAAHELLKSLSYPGCPLGTWWSRLHQWKYLLESDARHNFNAIIFTTPMHYKTHSTINGLHPLTILLGSCTHVCHAVNLEQRQDGWPFEMIVILTTPHNYGHIDHSEGYLSHCRVVVTTH